MLTFLDSALRSFTVMLTGLIWVNVATFPVLWAASDSVLMAAIGAMQIVVLALIALITAWMQQRTKAAVEEGTKATIVAAEIAVVKADQIGHKLSANQGNIIKKVEGLAGTVDQTHKLVNSAMAVQLKLNAELSRWKADETEKPEDRQAADLAERKWLEHEERQVALEAAKLAESVAVAAVESMTVTADQVTIVPAKPDDAQGA